MKYCFSKDFFTVDPNAFEDHLTIKNHSAVFEETSTIPSFLDILGNEHQATR